MKFIIQILLAIGFFFFFTGYLSFIEARDQLLKTKTDSIKREFSGLKAYMYEAFLVYQIFSIKVFAMGASNKLVLRIIHGVMIILFSIYAVYSPVNSSKLILLHTHSAKSNNFNFPLDTTTLVVAIITLISSFMFFIYSQQKIPLHNRNFFKGEPIRLLLSSLIIGIISTLRLVYLSKYKTPFNDYVGSISVTIIALILILVSIIWIFVNAMRTTLFSARIEQVMYDWATYELFLYVKPFFKGIFLNRDLQMELLITLQEDAFLGLKYCIENNLLRDFAENYNRWASMLVNLNKSQFTNKVYPLRDISTEFAEHYGDFYAKYYESLFLSHVRLIAQLHIDNDPMSEKALKDYFDFPIPIDETLYKIHFVAIGHLVNLTLRSHKDLTFQLLYDLIVQHVQNDIARNPSQTSSNSLSNLIKSFMRLAVDTNDMRLLIDSSHIMMRSADILLSSSVDNESDDYKNELELDNYGSEIERGFSNFLSNRVGISESWISQTTKILLEAALLALKLSQFEQVGFLVKYAVTSLDNNIINNTFESLLSSCADKESYLFQEYCNDFSGIPISDIYLIQKLGILLYGQQLYVRVRNVDFGKNKDKSVLDISTLKCDYTGYLIDKLTDSADSFRLLFLKDQYFMGRILRSLL